MNEVKRGDWVERPLVVPPLVEPEAIAFKLDVEPEVTALEELAAAPKEEAITLGTTGAMGAGAETRVLGALEPEIPTVTAAMEELAVAAFVELEAAGTGMVGKGSKVSGMSSSSVSGT